MMQNNVPMTSPLHQKRADQNESAVSQWTRWFYMIWRIEWRPFVCLHWWSMILHQTPGGGGLWCQHVSGWSFQFFKWGGPPGNICPVPPRESPSDRDLTNLACCRRRLASYRPVARPGAVWSPDQCSCRAQGPSWLPWLVCGSADRRYMC